LKGKSPVIAVSINGKPLKLPVVRGGDGTIKGIKGLSLKIKSKKLAALVKAIFNARRKQKQFK
jgi:hypothetical protein